jgi:nitroreductase
MDIDAFLALVKKRRSIRRFKPDDVPMESIEKMLEAARWAMSGANAQPWEFVVVRDKEILRQVAEAWYEPHREVYTIEQTRIPELRLRPLRDGCDTAPPWQDAPVMIMVLGDRRTYQATVLAAHFLAGEGGTDATYLKNVANATQLLHLAAAAQGLGSMWLSVNRPWGQEIKRLLGIPEILDVHTIVVVGYPAYTPPPSYRRPLTDIVHYERYDRTKYRSAEDIGNYLVSLRQEQASQAPEVVNI